MKKQDLEKAKIYDFKTKKQVADLPSKNTSRTARTYTRSKGNFSSPHEKLVGQIQPGAKRTSKILDQNPSDLWKPDTKKTEILKTNHNGQWSLEKNVNTSYSPDQNTLTMSEKEMRSEVGDNREQGVQVKKTDPPQIFDNVKASENAEKAEKGVHEQSHQAKAFQDKGIKRVGGVSEAGADWRRGEPGMARVRHKETLADIKRMPNPKLTKEEVKFNAAGQWKLHKAKNPDKKEDADLGEKVEKLVEQHAEENKEAERKEGHKILGKKENEKGEGYVHGLPKDHPALMHYKGHVMRRERAPKKGGGMTWKWNVKTPSGENHVVHLPESTAGFPKSIHQHIDEHLSKK